MSEPTDEKRWLDDERNVTLLYRGVVGVSFLLVLVDAFYEKHVHYEFEEWFGFYGAYGFVACVALVLAAKELRKLIKRSDDYYE